MARETVLQIRVTEAERKAIERLAAAERLPASTFIRRRLLLEADQRGLVWGSDNGNATATAIL
ncbi:hypothetical protein GC175_04985 [bacterium]|nr:hypothetical protein [bacterium]